LVGQATLARRASATPQPLRFKDDLFEHDRINTRARSLVRVLLRGKALVTVRELSVFTITEDARDQTVRLTRGKLAVSVMHSRMRSGEAIDIRTPNAIAAVRGTVVIVEVLRPRPRCDAEYAHHGDAGTVASRGRTRSGAPKCPSVPARSRRGGESPARPHAGRGRGTGPISWADQNSEPAR
jgi:hypothetical protein